MLLTSIVIFLSRLLGSLSWKLQVGQMTEPLRQLVTGWLSIRAVHIGFVMDKHTEAGFLQCPTFRYLSFCLEDEAGIET
jgi:hypothetical protein